MATEKREGAGSSEPSKKVFSIFETAKAGKAKANGKQDGKEMNGTGKARSEGSQISRGQSTIDVLASEGAAPCAGPLASTSTSVAFDLTGEKAGKPLPKKNKAANGQLELVALAPENEKQSGSSKKARTTAAFFAPGKAAPPVVDLTLSPPPKPSRPAQVDKGSSYTTFSQLAEARKAKLKGKRVEDAVPAAWPVKDEVHVGLSEGRWEWAKSSTWPPRQTKDKRKAEADGTFPYTLSNDLPPAPSLPELKRIPLGSVSELLPSSRCHRPLIDRIYASFAPLGGLQHNSPILLRQPLRRDGQLWTTLYAPRTADELLGDLNTASARTLRNWAKEVEVRGPAKPETHTHGEKRKSDGPEDRPQKKARPNGRHIVRRVDRKKRRRRADSYDDLDDFIVYGDEDDEIADSEGDATLDVEAIPGAEGSTPKRHGFPVAETPPPTPPPKSEFDELTNLIVLNGPPGSGKTCSVYAVASELGWDVFEVNAGSLRSRKELERLVGDVGNNHTLPGAARSNLAFQPGGVKSPLKKGAFNAFFKKKSQVIVLDDDDLPAAVEKAPAPVRQCLILLEEVDILYAQDKDFWNGVVELVANSMRPVVMTCNDLSLVPLDTLPVQTILSFNAPNPDLVVDYLRAIAFAEGHIVPADDLRRLYARRFRVPPDHPPTRSGPTVPHPFSSFENHPDIRQTMLQLQFWAQWAIGSSMAGVEWLDLDDGSEERASFSAGRLPASWQDELSLSEQVKIQTGGQDGSLGAMSETCEAVSFADAFIEHHAGHFAAYEHFPTTTDDLLAPGMTHLVAHPSVGPAAPRDREMAVEVIVRGSRLSSYAELWDDDIFAARRSEWLRNAELCTQFLPPRAPALPSPSVATDYIPFMRQLVALDDLADAAGIDNERYGLRSTRANPRYHRRIDLAPELLASLRSGLA